MHHDPLKSTQFRSLLKTFSQTQESEGPVSAVTLSPSSIKSHQIERRRNEPCICNDSTICPEDSKMWCLVRSTNDMPRWTWTFGLPSVTGIIHLESNDSKDRYHDCSSLECMGAKGTITSGFSTVWARFALPRWLSYRVLEVVAHRSRIGWKQYIRMRLAKFENKD